VDIIRNQLGAKFVLPEDEFKSFPPINLDDLDAAYDQFPEFNRWDIDHIRCVRMHAWIQ